MTEYHNTAKLIDVSNRVSALVKTSTVSTPRTGSLAITLDTTATKSTTTPPIDKQSITQSNYMTDTIEFIVAGKIYWLLTNTDYFISLKYL